MYKKLTWQQQGIQKIIKRTSNSLICGETISLRKTTVPMVSSYSFNGSNSANQDMLNVTKPEENKANAKSDRRKVK